MLDSISTLSMVDVFELITAFAKEHLFFQRDQTLLSAYIGRSCVDLSDNGIGN